MENYELSLKFLIEQLINKKTRYFWGILKEYEWVNYFLTNGKGNCMEKGKKKTKSGTQLTDANK